MPKKTPRIDWKIDPLAVPDAKAIGLDQLITQLWMRIAYENKAVQRRKKSYTRVTELASKMEASDWAPAFVGFEPGQGVAEAWLRADLLRVLMKYKKQKNTDLFAVARPLHLQATRLRNAGLDGDSDGSAILFKWLEDFDPDVLAELREWIKPEPGDSTHLTLDLPSYALLRLSEDEDEELISSRPRPAPRPLCAWQGKVYVEDLRSLMAYRDHLPRAVIVDHLQRLSALHLGLYLLKVYRAVTDLSQSGSIKCSECLAGSPPGEGGCPYRLKVVADCGDDARSAAAQLAMETWLEEEGAISQYVRAHLTLRKLQEFAEYVGRKPLPVETLTDIASVRTRATRGAIEERATKLTREFLLDVRKADAVEAEYLEELKGQYEALNVPALDIYLALLFQGSERRRVAYLRDLLDSLFMKNESGGVLRQPLGGSKRTRRFALGPGMIETLALCAFMVDTDRGLETRSIRVDEFVDRLERRYGFLVARAPLRLRDDPDATRVMIENNRLFRRRLREAGLFVDLSDAFLAQTLKPRVEVRR
jgi:hypothetical protein